MLSKPCRACARGRTAVGRSSWAPACNRLRMTAIVQLEYTYNHTVGFKSIAGAFAAKLLRAVQRQLQVPQLS